MAQGHLIGPNLLGKLYELTDAGGTTREGGQSAPGKQITFVVCNSTSTGGGWYEGIVRTHYSTSGGTFFHEDHPGVVEVRGANAEELTLGDVYMAIRTGAKSDGTPRFIAQVGGGSVATVNKTVVTNVACASDGLQVTYETVKVVAP